MTGRPAIGRRVIEYDELPSANDRAAELAAEPDAEGTVVIARRQTAGRGRLGRAWNSATDAGVWLSAVVRPPAGLNRPPVLTAWAAVAVADLIVELTGAVPAVKWPNDVLIAGRKVAGILIEQRAATIVGVGLNVCQSEAEFAAAGLPAAGSLLTQTGRAPDRAAVVAGLIRHLDSWYSRLLDADEPALEAAWRGYLGLVGRKVRVELADGRSRPGRLLDLSFQAVDLQQIDGLPARFRPEQVTHIIPALPPGATGTTGAKPAAFPPPGDN